MCSNRNLEGRVTRRVACACWAASARRHGPWLRPQLPAASHRSPCARVLSRDSSVSLRAQQLSGSSSILGLGRASRDLSLVM
eukprot:COSAG06_NODE_4291_length_4394_cov_1.783236_7_plen_82_part_00